MNLTSKLPRFAGFLLLVSPLFGQEEGPPRPPPNGPAHAEPEWHALVGATLHLSPVSVIDRATLILRDGKIARVLEPDSASSELPPPPAGARVWDYSGLHIYAGFIDPFVPIAVEADADRAGLHWNALVHPEHSALSGQVSQETAKSLRAQGFTAAGISPESGIFRGTTAVVSLPIDAERQGVIYQSARFHALAFERTGGRNGGYPDSVIGAIALVRQTLSDAAWYARHMDSSQEARNALLALHPDRDAALLFDCRNELEALRAIEVARESGRPAVVVGNGREFRYVDAFLEESVPLIVPLDFPDSPDLSSVAKIESTELETLMTWEQAPTNPLLLDEGGLLVALTSSKVESRKDFRSNLLKAVEQGLPRDRALAMITLIPAELLGVEDRLGTLSVGKSASLVVTDGDFFDKDTKIRDVWVEGEREELSPAPGPDLTGSWDLKLGTEELLLTVEKKDSLSIGEGDAKISAQGFSAVGEVMHFSLPAAADGSRPVRSFTGWIGADLIEGSGVDSLGRSFFWSAARRPASAEARPDEETALQDLDEIGEDGTLVPDLPGYPFGPYSLAEPPAAQNLRLLHATIWTSGPAGILRDAELSIQGGKVDYVGPIRSAGGEGQTELDLTGKHITPGLIDCHSHSGLSLGINESGQAVTSEVRIRDSIDPSSIAWYRELAGGLTAANLLHGSANPIGGQSQVVKLRWGARRPADMILEDAPPGVKFALGENVKQANWGENFTTRYPQTRMGVESLLRDRFVAAREYLAARRRGEDVRTDLELEVLGEVLQGTRLVHCHSYRQDEILMLCRIADEFSFRIGTFQHVLEGYKVAEAIREHALGASTFSDWWAYKVEVQDAIPYNGSLMWQVGVNVSFNSDSNELARRLNLEAAKAVRYGGTPPDEALKFVTLNPAIQLGVSDRIGSLEPGKDGDFAIWSGSPLSTRSLCEATFIEGREYFSLAQDKKHREWIALERQRLIEKILAAPKGRSGRDRKEPATPGAGS